MDGWRKVWREGIVPQLSVKALQGLLVALERDDHRLLQGATTSPPPLMCTQDWPVEGGCVIGFCGAVQNGGLLPSPGHGETLAYDTERSHSVATIGQVEEYFAQVCYQCDQAMGEPGECRFFLNWFDETPRDEMLRNMIPEVELALAGKEASCEPSVTSSTTSGGSGNFAQN